MRTLGTRSAYMGRETGVDKRRGIVTSRNRTAIALTVGAAAAAATAVAAAASYQILRTRNYYWRPVDQALSYGYTERTVTVADGVTLNVAESPTASHGRTPLLLIPGQGSIWQDYARVLPGLAEHHHVIAVDVHGHGASSWEREDYSCVTIADDLDTLAQEVFDRPYVIAGHSSGGLIAAQMAAAHPQHVRGLLIEDAPFFSTEADRVPGTFVGQDNHLLIDYFDEDSATREPDYLVYSLPRMYIGELFGNAWEPMVRRVIRQRRKDPGATPVIPVLGETINRIWESLSHPYDPQWSYDFFISRAWHEGFDQAETLSAVTAPTVFLKASSNRAGDVLLAALDDDDLALVESLVPHLRTHHIKAGHDIHFEKPEWYVGRVNELTAGL